MGATQAATSTGGIHFLNLAYFFRILYETVFGGGGAHAGVSHLLLVASHIWVVVTVLSVLFVLFCVWVLVYSTTRIFQVRQEEAPRYATITERVAHEQLEASRWGYIKELIAGTNPSSWREAIIEADIMLDELLTRQGYTGATVGDKLKQANPTHFSTLQNAWQAHQVRNAIAHEGSAYQLTDRTAYHTIANYEAVFREFGEVR